MAGAAADVFAWAGVVLFAATGLPPFEGATVFQVIDKVLQAEPSHLGALPEPLYSIVLACLEKQPDKRPRMEEVLLRLLEAPAPDAGTVDPDQTHVHPLNGKRRRWNPLPNWLRRNR